MTHNTRDNLLRTAAKLFHEEGYVATGVATILREAGANSGSLYHFFPNKEALLLGVLQWYRDHLRELVLDPVEQAEPDPVERIFRLLDWYREGMKNSDCRQGCPIGKLALEVSDTYPELRPAIHDNFAAWAEGVEQWLREAGDRLPADCDTQALARFVLTVMEGGLMQVRAANTLQPFDDSVAVLRAHIDHLLGHRARDTAEA